MVLEKKVQLVVEYTVVFILSEETPEAIWVHNFFSYSPRLVMFIQQITHLLPM